MLVLPEEKTKGGYLQEYTAPRSEVLKESFVDAYQDNLFTKALFWNDRNNDSSPIIPKEEAERRARKERFEIDIPDEGIPNDSFDLLVERQYQKRRRADTIAAAPSGVGTGLLSFGSGLIGNFMDPIGAAASFIPFVGQAKYAGMLAKAASPLARAGIRLGVGALEGAAGAALLAPVNIGISKKIGDDYDSVKALMDIAYGGAMGAGLHMGAGAISDAISRGINPSSAGPKGKVAENLVARGHDVRYDMHQTALAQALEDRPIHVSPIAMLDDYQSKLKIGELTARLEQAIQVGDERQIAKITKQKTSLEARIGKEAEVAPPGGLEVRQITKDSFTDVDGKLKPVEFRADIEKAVSEGLELRLRDGDTTIAIQSLTPEGGIDINGRALTNEQMLDKGLEVGAPRAIGGEDANLRLETEYAKPRGEAPVLNEQAIDFELRKTAAVKPGARFVQPDIVQKHAQELSTLSPMTRVEDAKMEMDDALSFLKMEADRTGMDVASLLGDADAIVKQADEQVKALRAMGLCLVKGGT